MGKVFLSLFFSAIGVTSATDVSYQGGCSCVQDISVTLCEKNIMFWGVSGTDSEIIGLLWNLSFLEYCTDLFFLGLFLSFIVPSFLPLLVTLVSDSCFCL